MVGRARATGRSTCGTWPTVVDGPDEVDDLHPDRLRPGGRRATADGAAGRCPAVTIAVAKKKGSNAVWVAREVEAALERAAAAP